MTNIIDKLIFKLKRKKKVEIKKNRKLWICLSYKTVTII